MDHSTLCDLAVRWLKRPMSAGGPGCLVALKECKTGWDGEVPDAIGFIASGNEIIDGSVVVEAKVSRSDFRADFNKLHRESDGVGRWRYYIAPQGLISIHELPDRWGLLEVNSRGHIKAISGPAAHLKKGYNAYVQSLGAFDHSSNKEREVFLLVKAFSATQDPQKVLDMLRESNNRNARLARDNERLKSANERYMQKFYANQDDFVEPIAIGRRVRQF